MQIREMGEDVTIFVKKQIGTDAFNCPIYEETEEVVNNVFIGVPTSDEVVTELNLTGRRISHILGIPKGDTHEWEDVIVSFHGRTWRTYGIPAEGNPALMPFDWVKNVKVEAYNGER